MPAVTLLTIYESGEPACLEVVITEDQILENNESFTVVLSSGDPAVDLSNSAATTVEITDNDSKEQHELVRLLR